jgi:hypothetical protein
MTAVIMALQMKDRVRQDSAPIALMYRTMGTQAAEEVVTRALAEIGFAVTDLSAKVQARNMTDLSRQLRRLGRMSLQLGMVSLSQAATDLSTCMEEGDQTAFSAVWARFLRVAERSLVVETGLIDQSQ